MTFNKLGQDTPRILAAHDGDGTLSAGAIARQLEVSRNKVIGVLNRHRPGWGDSSAWRLAHRPPVRVIDGAAPAQTCTWMIDNGNGVRDPDARWCCAPVVKGRAWCAEHMARVYRKPTPGEEAAVGGGGLSWICGSEASRSIRPLSSALRAGTAFDRPAPRGQAGLTASNALNWCDSTLSPSRRSIEPMRRKSPNLGDRPERDASINPMVAG